jgi:hypothetical protein
MKELEIKRVSEERKGLIAWRGCGKRLREDLEKFCCDMS